MHRNTNGSGLVRDGAGNGLTNPPGRIGTELKALSIVEFFHRLDQAEISLLNEVQKGHPTAHIAFGNADNQTQVGLSQLFLGFVIACFHTLGNAHFLLRGQERHLADFL